MPESERSAPNATGVAFSYTLFEFIALLPLKESGQMRKAVTQAHALSLTVYVLTSLHMTDSCYNYHCMLQFFTPGRQF